jgi:hypothetical protein
LGCGDYRQQAEENPDGPARTDLQDCPRPAPVPFREPAMNTADNLVLEHLRAVRADVSATRQDVKDLNVRMSNVEQGITLLHRDVSNLRSVVAEQGARLDRLTDRVERIEHHLELSG